MIMTDIGAGRGWLAQPAAASLRRVDAAIGHPLQVTSAGRTNAEQWDAWRKYGSPRAAYPGTSTHESGLAVDTDERLDVLSEHGWTRPFNNPARKPYEPWHYLYDANLDQHLTDPAPDISTLGDTMPLRIIDSPAYRAARQRVIHNGSAAMPVPDGWTPPLIAAGVPYHAYDHDSDLMAEINMVWQLGGLDAETAARKTAEMLKTP